MRLIRGAPGAGKTALILTEFRESLRSAASPRIVVPTATLVRHLQHELARDGAVFPPNSVISLHRFCAECAPDVTLVPDGLLRVIVRDCLERLRIPEFARLASTEGLISTVIETIGLFENEGVTSAQLAANRKLSPHGKAFARLWRAVDEAIAERGFQTRPALMQAAAAGLTPGAKIWMDGFVNLSPLECTLVTAMARRCDLTLTLTESTAGTDIHRFALQLGAEGRLLHGASRKPAIAIVEARSMEREAADIAARVLELHRQGTAFRRIGVALRDTSGYLALLRSTFERFGIPARFYFSPPLRSHPAAVFASGLVSGILNGWDFEPALATLRAHPRWGRSADFDRFDFAVREAMPGRGAEELLQLCESEWLRDALSTCLSIDAWKTRLERPAIWQQRLEKLAADLYRPGMLDQPSSHLSVAAARSHVAALRAWVTAIQSVAPFWIDAERAITLNEFWRVASVAVENAVFQVPDDRVDVVHVMSVYEARQWDVTALFVCGMTDRDFPKRWPQNLLFPEKASGQESDERALFESLRTRATQSLVFTYPAHDASGKSVEHSRLLDGLGTPQRARLAKPRIAAANAAGVAGRIHTPALLTEMAGLHQSVSLTGLEDLAQCRFKFFSGRTLGLRGAPERPGERLQPRVTGSILHEALDQWQKNKTRDFVQLFEEAFDKACRESHLPAGYRLEVERILFRAIAARVSATEQWSPDSTDAEVNLTLDFPGGVTVKCRIDRIDRFGSDCVIIDYKSSKTANVKLLVESNTRLQGPLYALAVRERLNLNPVAMIYWAVREDEQHGWGHIPGASQELNGALKEMPADWAVAARERTIERLAGFLNGAVMARPEEPDQCRWCEFADACRVEQQELVMIRAAHE